jgi:hypothetical protein
MWIVYLTFIQKAAHMRCAAKDFGLCEKEVGRESQGKSYARVMLDFENTATKEVSMHQARTVFELKTGDFV